MLENPTEALNDMSYFDCIDSVMENSKVLSFSFLIYLFCVSHSYDVKIMSDRVKSFLK